MQQFIDEWPNSTDINCFWCCHKFESTPCSIPESLTNDLFKVKGCFCSFNCATAYLFSKESNKNSIWEKYSILHLLRNKLMKINDNSIIKPAPPREALKSFGGYLTINEFRNSIIKFIVSLLHQLLFYVRKLINQHMEMKLKQAIKNLFP